MPQNLLQIYSFSSSVMANSQARADRFQVSLSLKAQAFLELLAQKGSHGAKATDVARTFVEAGIREAIEKGHISQEERRQIQGAK